jgi:peptide/nickel transport system substrate-binding protein
MIIKTKLLTPFMIVPALALFVLVLTSCSPATDESAEGTHGATPQPAALSASLPKRGGTLRTESNFIPYVTDPATDGIGTGQVGLLIAEALVWVGEDGVPQPNLVKSWEVSEDAKEWTLHLREGVKFNNGKPFGADDVIWNLRHWLDPDTGSAMATRLNFLSPAGIEKVDDLTIKLHLDRPYTNVLLSLYGYSSMIAPEGGWKDFYSGDPADAVGTGPFLLQSFSPDERMVLVRNPNYWQLGADGQPLPYVDKVIVTSGWDDAARLAALIGGEADYLAPGEGILPVLKRYADKITVKTYYTGWVTPIVMRTDMPPFDDVRVRTALKLVQDRKRIRDLVMPLGPVAYDHMIPSGDGAYCPTTDVNREQDIEQARALLAEAGYPDGIELELAVPNIDFRPNFAQVYQEMAAKAGITVNINILPNSAFWDQWMQWPFATSGFNGRVPATANMNLALRCGGDWNESHYCNEQLDALLEAADSELNIERRRNLYCRIQTIMQEDSGYIIPFWAATFSASPSNLHFPSNWPRDTWHWHLYWFSNQAERR